MDRVQLHARLPGPCYANTRWLYNCLLDLCGEASTYTGTLAHLREAAGYGSGPESAPRTSLMLDEMRRAGLITYTYLRTKEGARRIAIQVCELLEERCA